MIRIEGNVEDFKEWLAPVSAIADETRFFIKPEGLEIKVVDPANVAMVHTNLSKSAFYKYEVDEVLTAGIDLTEINGMLEYEEDSDVAVMDIVTSKECYEGDPETKVSTLSVRTDGVLVDSISTLNPAGLRKTPKIPTLECTAEFTIDADLLKHIVKKSMRVSDYLNIEVTKNEELETALRFYAMTEKTRRFDAEFRSASILRCERNTKGLYSLDYFSDMANSINGRNVRMQFSELYPLYMQFEVLDGGSTTFTLAPRIESD